MHRFFSKPETLLRLRRGPLGDYLDRYADWLSEQGFCRAAARLHLVQIADFSLWLDKQGLTLNDVQPTVIDSFIEDRRRRVKPHAERSTLQRFLRLVRPEAMYTGFSTPHRFPSSSSGFPPPFPGGAWSCPRVVPHVAAHSPSIPFGLLAWRDDRLRAADCPRCDWIRAPSRLSSQPRPCQAVGHSSPRLSPLLVPAGGYHERSGSLRASCGHVARINYPEVPFCRPSSPSAGPVRSEQCRPACGITPSCCCSPGWASVPMRSCG